VERLSGLDASFLYFETPNQHMHVLAVIEFDPATAPDGYSFQAVKDMIRSRLHLAPPLHRRLARVPFNVHHPVWVEDPDFDLDYHVRRVGCPAPGTKRELAELVDDFASRQLNRNRPLWQLLVVEGLEGGRIAAVAKMHHCTIDGVSGANLMVHFFDLEPAPPPPAAIEDLPKPERVPSDLELFGRSLLSRAARPNLLHVARQLPGTVGAVRRFAKARREREGPGMAAPLTAPRTIYNTPITSHRQVALADVALADVKAIKNQHGTTVNDVVQAVCAGALRRHMRSHDRVPDKSLIAACPISVRDGDDGRGSNQVSAMISSLYTDIADPVQRLLAIHEANKGAKEEHHAIGAGMLQNWAEFAAPTTFSLAARVYTNMRLSERMPVPINLVISNVPGPPIPLYFAGSKLTELYPLGPIFDGVALNVTVVSYMDRLFWGFMACRETVPGLWDLAAGVHEALEELKNPPVRTRRPARRKKAASKKQPAARARAAG
jgi:WS/DGAT/MGAT family acyltransferase